MKIAAHSGLFIEHSLQEALRMIKHLGFDGIEISCLEPHLSGTTSLIRVKEIRNLAVHELGLEIPVLAGHMGAYSTASDSECMKSFADFQKMLEWSAILGAEAVSLLPGGPDPNAAQDYHYLKEAAWLGRCAEEAGKYRKKLLLETKQGSLTETAQSHLRLLELIPQPHVGIIHDSGNLLPAGTETPYDSLKQLEKRLMHVHIKDVKREGRTFFFRRLGEGEIDYRRLFHAFREIGYDRWITLESAAHLPECGSFHGEECDCSHCVFEKLDYEIKQVKRLLAGG